MPSLEAIVAAHQRQLETLRTGAATAVGTVWDRLAGLSDAEAERFAATAATVVAGAQSATVTLADAYLAAFLREALGEPVRPVGLSGSLLSGAAVRNGTNPLDVYRRGVITARAMVSDGHSLTDALSAGRARSVQAAATDVALSNRAAAGEVMSNEPRVVGYRRVLTGRSCAFCATASTQRYRTGNLLPLHSHCDCDIAPIVGDRDPGQVINRELVSGLKAEGGPQYWRDRGLQVDADGTIVRADGSTLQTAVHEHGELGPVLTDARHDFTAAADLAA